MNRSITRRCAWASSLVGAVGALGGLVTAAGAQPCAPEWTALDGGMNTYVYSFAEFDGAIYAGGSFTMVAGEPVDFLARWDGESWSAVPGSRTLGGAFDIEEIYAITSFDDGSGPALYVAGSYRDPTGSFGRGIVSRWDGAMWTPLGAGEFDNTLYALEVFDDGSGPALYLAGAFRFLLAPAPVELNRIARWDGDTWNPVGGGMDNFIRTLAVYDGALHAAGRFGAAGGETVHKIASWDGESWSPLFPGLGSTGIGTCNALAVRDGVLYAGGSFTVAEGAPARRLAKWDGAAWEGMGGANGDVRALTVIDDVLYVGGEFTQLQGSVAANYVAMGDGVTWSPLGDGTSGRFPGVHALGGFVGDLFAGGRFEAAGGVAGTSCVARWGCASAPECYADCDESGELDFFDFLCFQNLFAAGDLEADCDESGALDFFDFLCFQNAFAAGCP